MRPDTKGSVVSAWRNQTVRIVQSEPTWIRVDNEILCVAALAEVRSHVQRISESQMQWLWAVSALRVAMQTFIVGSFGTAAGLESMSPKLAEEFMQARRDPSKRTPNPRMERFPDLYRHAKKRHRWAPGQDVDRAVKVLNNVRNNVEHFMPNKAWSIEPGGLPDTTRSVLSAISDLGWGEARELPWHSQERLDECRDLVADILEDLNDL